MTRTRTAPAEHWRLDAGDADVAVLDVPAALQGERCFDVDLQFSVRTPERPGAWLEVTLELDGAREWTRRVEAACPGQADTLDYHCRRRVPEGRALRIRALTRVGGGARRQRLLLAAQRVDDDG
jgi:hypothetical protein